MFRPPSPTSAMQTATAMAHHKQEVTPERRSEAQNTEQLTRISSVMLFVFFGEGAHLIDFMENSGNCQRDK